MATLNVDDVVIINPTLKGTTKSSVFINGSFAGPPLLTGGATFHISEPVGDGVTDDTTAIQAALNLPAFGKAVKNHQEGHNQNCMHIDDVMYPSVVGDKPTGNQGFTFKNNVYVDGPSEGSVLADSILGPGLVVTTDVQPPPSPPHVPPPENAYYHYDWSTHQPRILPDARVFDKFGKEHTRLARLNIETGQCVRYAEFSLQEQHYVIEEPKVYFEVEQPFCDKPDTPKLPSRKITIDE